MSVLDEKRFKALGQEWIARFDFNATCAVEEDTGESFYAFAAPFLTQLDKGDVGDPAKVLAALGTRKNSAIRLLLFHALSGAHDVTLEDVGAIIQEIGLKAATEVTLWAIAKGIDFGAADEAAEGNAKPKPTPTGNRRQRKAAAKRG